MSVKCPIDGKRCYIHYSKLDGLPIRCRHGTFLEGDLCPYEQKFPEKSLNQIWGEIEQNEDVVK